MKPVRFEVLPGEPAKFIVHAADGKTYDLDIRVAVVEVTDNEVAGSVPNLTCKIQVIQEIRASGGEVVDSPMFTLSTPSKKSN